MRIQEAYEHESLRPYQAAEESCPAGACSKVSTQCVEVSAPLKLTPVTSVGAVSVTCQGSPEVVCTTESGGGSCCLVMKQCVCISVPVSYGVAAEEGTPGIACSDCGC